MSRYYVSCELEPGASRLVLGTLHQGELTFSEVGRFENAPEQDEDSGETNIPYVYEKLVETLRPLGEHDEPVNAISCHSWPSDYLLFKSDGTLATISLSRDNQRLESGRQKVLSKLSLEKIYEESGAHDLPGSTLFQLAAEKTLRFGRARQLLPVADGFNYLLSGVARFERSQASTTQLFSPVAKTWSETLMKAAGVSAKLFPPVVSAGTDLGPLRPDLAKDTNLREARVFACCSHERAAALAGLPLNEHENWAFLWPGRTTLIGTYMPKPFINEASREMGFSHELGYGDSVLFYKRTLGLSILDECRQFWREKDRQMDDELLTHLAASAPPFEALINPADPRFLAPGDMPLKIQAYCKETNQEVPWKPGSVIRCVLESLALLYRQALTELDYLTGRNTTGLCFLGSGQNSLLKTFIANALQLPTLVVPPEAAAVGNIAIMAVAMGHLRTIEEAREAAKRSLKMEMLMPHATVWNTAYRRFVELAIA